MNSAQHQTASPTPTTVQADDAPKLDAHLPSEVGEALDFCRSLISTTPRDTTVDPIDALLYAVLVGDDCEAHLTDPTHQHDDLCGGQDTMALMAKKHAWSTEVVAKLRHLRAAVATVTTTWEQQQH